MASRSYGMLFKISAKTASTWRRLQDLVRGGHEPRRQDWDANRLGEELKGNGIGPSLADYGSRVARIPQRVRDTAPVENESDNSAF